MADLIGGETKYFNPPSPWGEGRSLCLTSSLESSFQSTLPVRGGTLLQTAIRIEDTISIHPPRGGRDAIFLVNAWKSIRFQSTLPVGGGTRG